MKDKRKNQGLMKRNLPRYTFLNRILIWLGLRKPRRRGYFYLDTGSSFVEVRNG